MIQVNLLEEMYLQDHLSKNGAIFEFISAIVLLLAVIIWRYRVNRKNKKRILQCLGEIAKKYPDLNIKNIQDLYLKSSRFEFFFSEDAAKKEQNKLRQEKKVSFIIEHDGDYFLDKSGFILFVINP